MAAFSAAAYSSSPDFHGYVGIWVPSGSVVLSRRVMLILAQPLDRGRRPSPIHARPARDRAGSGLVQECREWRSADWRAAACPSLREVLRHGLYSPAARMTSACEVRATTSMPRGTHRED